MPLRNLTHTKESTGSSIHGDGRAFLDAIIATTRDRVAALKRRESIDALAARGRGFARRPFARALRTSPPSIIAEVKKASPSKGLIREDFDPLRLGGAYADGGAASLSVVTEPTFFQGDDHWIANLRDSVPLPILRKDFVIDSIQIAESAALGADAVLLIARILTPESIAWLAATADSMGLEVLFEAHDHADLQRILPCKPGIVGINARNLDTFSMDTSQFERLREQIPVGCIAVAESGIDSPEQIAALCRIGYQAFLVGETLVRADNPASQIQLLRSANVQ